MADNKMKLELVLLGKDLLGKILGKDIGFLKQFKKEGEAAAKAADKLNAAKKKLSTNSGGKSDTETLKRRTSETNRAAAAQEKLNNAIKREPKRGGSGGRRSGGGSGGGGSMLDDAALTAAGAAGLWASKQGMSSAMSKQEALTDLHNAFYRSSLGAAELNAQMREGEKIADILGNKLPGTTADYLQLFAVMKERGIEADSILKGAGKSAAYLGVANKEDRLDVGSNIARFGQMFNLKTENEYMGAAELMSRAKTTYGITSSELMEAVKDFSGRTGKGLGLDGQQGAEDTLRYLAFLRAKTGMQGLMVGTAASSFFGQYMQAKEKKQDPTEELKKLTGVDLQVFDKKGKFLGLENAVKEFSKLKGKLSDEQMVGFGNKIAGEEGSAVFQAMVKNGEQFGAFNREMSEAASLQEKSAKNAENLTNKVEALTGSLENLGAAGFMPLFAPIAKLTDSTNEWVGSLTEVAKANPGIARMATTVLTLSSAFLTLKYGGGMLSNFLGGANNSFATAWKSADGFQKKMGALRTAAASPISVSLQVMAAGVTIDHLLKVFEEVRDRANKLEENNKTLREQYDSLMGSGKLFNGSKETGQNRPELDSFADKVLETMKQGRALEFALQPERAGLFEHFWTSQRPYASQSSTKVGDNFWTPFSPNKAAGMWGKSDVTAGFRDPNVLARVLAKAESGAGMNLNDNSIKLLVSAIEQVAGKEKIQQAREILNEENRRSKINLANPNPLNFNQLFNPLQQTTNQTAQKFGQLQQPANTLGQDFFNLSGKASPLGETFTGLNTNAGNSSGAVQRLGDAAQSVANRLNSLQITPPTFAPIQIPGFGQSAAPAARGFFNNQSGQFSLGRAKGGSVTKGNEYRINEVGQEFFTPSASGSIVSNDVLRNRRNSVTSSPNVSLNVSINIDGSSGDARQIAEQVRKELAFVVRDIKDEFSPNRLAQKVEYAAQRDSERL